jgi:anti-sigma B factor antagonist
MKSWTVDNGNVAIIELRGSLVGDGDVDKFREMVSDFIEQGNKHLIINLHRVHYMNSSGIGVLLAAHASYAKNGGQVHLAGLQNTVQNLLVITKLIDVFEVHDTLHDAIETFKKSKTLL